MKKYMANLILTLSTGCHSTHMSSAMVERNGGKQASVKIYRSPQMPSFIAHIRFSRTKNGTG